ncbi:DJ-1/PfpI family protein [Spiroplasma endosymbiont of Crioceris asparagi]|uniref:DJ-1/PfpI family protein n=1 Tax=Spiroplasma endosymbiont of Crioceris asparagi TaxID=3066286 RepID=UPI0030D6233E
MNKLALFLIEGFEDTEAIATLDVIRRASKMFPNKIKSIDLIGIKNTEFVTGGWGTKVVPDKYLKDVNIDEYQGFIFPGGGLGVENLFKEEILFAEIAEQYKKNKLVAAICAAPQVLGKIGILDNKKVTHYPGCTQYLDKALLQSNTAAIRDGNIITGSSIGGAIAFGLEIIKFFLTSDEAKQIEKSLVIY